MDQPHSLTSVEAFFLYQDIQFSIFMLKNMPRPINDMKTKRKTNSTYKSQNNMK